MRSRALGSSAKKEPEVAATHAPRSMGFLEQKPRMDREGNRDGRGLQAKVFGGDPQFESDGTAGPFGNIFEDSASQFRVLDNLEPVAPMDKIAIGQDSDNSQLRGKSTAGQPMEATGIGRLDALYVPPYSRPDAFPRVEGDSCICGPASVLNPAGPQCIDGLGLSAVTTAECPKFPFKLPNCTGAKAGEMCEADGAECGADASLNNCKVWDVYRKDGTPSVALPGVPSSAQMPAWATAMGLKVAKPSSLVLPVVCRCGKEIEVKALPPAVQAVILSTTTTTTTKAPDGPQCADGLRLFPIDPKDCPEKPYKLSDCDSAKPGEICEMDGTECGASSSLNNCKVWDVYRKAAGTGLAVPAGAAASGAPGAAPSGAAAQAATTTATTTTTTKALHIEGTHSPDNTPQMGQSFHYYRRVPVFNSSTYYELKPADVTYSNGNYWLPQHADGLVAPFDRLPLTMYPLQAPADVAAMVPVAARGDRLDYKFARYIDQVEDRSKECDNLSPDCTVDCVTGDQVELRLGSLSTVATVVMTHISNMLTVEFTPTAANHRPFDTVKCPVGAGCTLFKVCHTEGLPCLPEEDKSYFDYAHVLQHNYTCPDGYKVCGTVSQVVQGNFLRKGQMACRAAVAKPASMSLSKKAG